MELNGTEDIRTRLDILEDLADRLTDSDVTEDTFDFSTIADEVADRWPSIAWRPRVVQWLQAGSPDLDDTPEVDWVTDVRTLIKDEDSDSVTRSVFTMLGVVLYGVVRAVADDVVDSEDDLETARKKIADMIADHRARVMTHDGDAMTPPYEWVLAYSFDSTSTVVVTPRD